MKKNDPPIVLKYNPREWQKQCHEMRKRFSVFVVHRRAGKTMLAIMELVDKAMKFDKDLGLFIYLGPKKRQTKSIAWLRLKKILEPLYKIGAIKIEEGDDPQITFKHNGAVLHILGATMPDDIRGLGIDGVILDEVGQLPPYLWTDVVRPCLSDRKGWAIFIGTPCGINLFSELYQKGLKRPDWFCARYTVYDTDALDVEEIKLLKEDMPEKAFAREYLCDMTASGDDQLISLGDVEKAAKRVYQKNDVEHAPIIMGVDPARFGDDRSVIIIRQGLQVFHPVIYQGLDNMQLATRIANLIEHWKPDAVFCDAGAGAGVIDRLHQLKYDIIEIPFNSQANSPKTYTNRRTEMWWGIKEWIEKGGAIPNDEIFKIELSTPIYWYDSDDRRVLEPKHQIKKRLLGSSPDIADALALTFASPIYKKHPEDIYIKKGNQVIKDYDPYKVLQ